jgi:hypothetical protein
MYPHHISGVYPESMFSIGIFLYTFFFHSGFQVCLHLNHCLQSRDDPAAVEWIIELSRRCRRSCAPFELFKCRLFTQQPLLCIYPVLSFFTTQ